MTVSDWLDEVERDANYSVTSPADTLLLVKVARTLFAMRDAARTEQHNVFADRARELDAFVAEIEAIL